MPRYKWKPGARLKINAQVAGDRLEKIKTQRDGKLRPEDVVDDARPAKSPLHNHFEWRDSVAAEKFRQEQAMYMIRSVVLIIEDAPRDSAPIRAFVSVIENDEKQYVSLESARSNPDMWRQVLERALKEAQDWSDRYEAMNQLAPIRKAVKRMVEKHAPQLARP